MSGLQDSADLAHFIGVEDRAASSPVIVHVPHASRTIPVRYASSFTVPRSDLEAELDRMTDTGTDVLADAMEGASRVQHGLSRLVVDVERFAGDEEEMNAVGMGVLYTHGSLRQELRRPTTADRRDLLGYHRAYGAAFGDLVDRVLVAHGAAVIVDLHSFPAVGSPYELHASDQRPELCIGADRFHTSEHLVDAVRTAFGGFEAVVNEPFRGTYVPTRQYGVDTRVQSVMLEIRRDLYLDAALELRGPGLQRITAALRALGDALDTRFAHPAS
jgi:N-formylglutamate amidohydrolase